MEPRRYDSRDAFSWQREQDGARALRLWHLELFTPRGWWTLGLGAALILVAWWLGRHELMALGVALLALSTASWLLVLRLRQSLGPRRTLHTPTPAAGEPVRVSLDCTDAVQIRETLPEDFGPGPEFTGPGTIDYELVFRNRGLHLLGPARQVIADPLGLVRGLVPVGDTVPVPVRAELIPLERFIAPGERVLTGDARFSRSTTADYYDVATRDYQQGDSIRQVHWKATARHGKLMVRQENHVATAQAMLVLDRTAAHWHTAADLRLGIAQGQRPQLSSSRRFEQALSLACSLGQRYAASGYQVAFRDLAGTALGRHDPQLLSENGARASFEDFHAASVDLALVEGQGHGPLVGPELQRELLGLRDEPVILILGGLEPAQVAELAGLSRSVRQVELFVLAAHPERMTEALAPLAHTGWRVRCLPGNNPFPRTSGDSRNR